MRIVVAALLALTVVPSALAQTAGTCSPSTATQDLDIAGVRARLYNNGGLFWKGAGNVYNVPKAPLGAPVSPNSIFAQGLWVGGMVGTEVRQAAATYGNWEFWPGPLSAPGNGAADCSAYDRIYRVSSLEVARYNQNGTASPDLLAWPWQLGAPVVDGDGNPNNYNLAGGDRPEIRGSQTAFWVMNDAGNAHARTGSKPIGLEVRVTAFAARSTSNWIREATFYRYTVINRSTQTLSSAHIGVWSDADLGNAHDDYVGSDSTLGLAYAYNADNDDEGPAGYGIAPPAVGYMFVEGASTRMVYFQNSAALNGDPAANTTDYYNYLRGIWRDNSPMYGCGDGYGSDDASCGLRRWMFAGDPVAGTGWTERTPKAGAGANTPGDRRLLLSAGPFAVLPGEERYFTVAVIHARGADHLASVTELKNAARSLRATYAATNGFRNYTEPPYPAAPSTSPSLVAPADAATQQPSTFTLNWNGVAGVTHYEYSLNPEPFRSSDALITRASVGTSVSHNLSAQVASFPNGVYWRVRGVSDGGAGPWSAARHFTLSGVPLASSLAGFKNFLVTQNAAGALAPPEYGALDFNSGGTFPRIAGTTAGANGTSGRIQSTNTSIWGLQTFNTTTSSTDYNFTYFNNRVIRDGANAPQLLGRSYEWRFTQAGGKAYDFFSAKCLYNVPFELWDVGTSSATTDDVRMVPITLAMTGGKACAFDLGTDHPASGGTNDPQTDAVYWYRPANTTPGQAGYDFAIAEMQRLGTNYSFEGLGAEVFARMVLVNFNGGMAPTSTTAGGPFNATMPEAGTVFRIETSTSSIDAARLAAPADGATAVNRPVQLYWQEPGLVAKRVVQVARDAAFADLVYRDSSATGPSHVVEGLAQGTQYYWRVGLALANGTRSAWSAAWSFTAGATAVSNYRFTVDLSPMQQMGLFSSAAGDSLEVHSGFNGWNCADAGAPGDCLLAAGTGTSVYTLDYGYPSSSAGARHDYRYVLNFNTPAFAQRFGRTAPAGAELSTTGLGRALTLTAQEGQGSGTEFFHGILPGNVIPSGTTVNVTFQVNMKEALAHASRPFVPGSDSVFVLLEDPLWLFTQGDALDANGGAKLLRKYLLTDSDGDDVYSGTFPVRGATVNGTALGTFSALQYRYTFGNAGGGFFTEPEGPTTAPGRRRARFIVPQSGVWPANYTVTQEPEAIQLTPGAFAYECNPAATGIHSVLRPAGCASSAGRGHSGALNLTVESANPLSGITVALALDDPANAVTGATPVTRSYAYGSKVWLTAPETSSGGAFEKWLRNGKPFAASQRIPVHLYDNMVYTAVYAPAKTKESPVPVGQTGTVPAGETGVTLAFTSGSQTQGSLTFNRFSGAPGTTGTPPAGVTEVASDRFWRVTNTGLTDFTYTITLDLNGVNGIKNFNDVRIIKRNGPADAWVDLTTLAGVTVTRDATARTVTIAGLRSFSDFAIGGSEQALSTESKLSVRAYLAGAYSSGTLRTALYEGGRLPLEQPYSVTSNAYFAGTRAYSGAEQVSFLPSGTVDWVLVELRSTTAASSVVATRAGLLKADGTITDIDGSSELTFDGLTAGDYYVVVRHRNHLAVMSAAPVGLAAGTSTSYDFTTGQDKAFGTNALCAMSPAAFALCPGDASGDGVVKYSGAGNDRAFVLTRTGLLTGAISGYLAEDINLDGSAKYSGAGNDRAVILGVVGTLTGTKTSQVPNQ